MERRADLEDILERLESAHKTLEDAAGVAHHATEDEDICEGCFFNYAHLAGALDTVATMLIMIMSGLEQAMEMEESDGDGEGFPLEPPDATELN